MSSKIVNITYCGAWGYASRFRKVKKFLEERIPGIVITGEATPTATGAFEVVMKDTGKKYWSKLDGQGYLDGDDASMQKVADALKADLQ